MDLSAINSGVFSQAMSNADTTASKVSQSASKKYAEASDKELMDVCKQFEAYFIEQVLKEAEKTIPKSEEHDQSTENLVSFFKGNLIQEYASIMQETSGGLGLAQSMYEQMKRNMGVNEIPVVSPVDTKEEV